MLWLKHKRWLSLFWLLKKILILREILFLDWTRSVPNASMCVVPVVTAIQKVSTAKPFLRWPRSNQPWPSFFCGRPFPGFFRFNADKPGCWEGKGKKKGRTQCSGVKYFTKSLWTFTFLGFEKKFRKHLLNISVAKSSGVSKWWFHLIKYLVPLLSIS